MVNVKIQRASPTATFPTYGSEGAACMDLYADIKGMPEFAMGGIVWVEPHTTVKIPTGFAFQPPEGYCGLIFARSGLATKKQLKKLYLTHRLHKHALHHAMHGFHLLII